MIQVISVVKVVSYFNQSIDALRRLVITKIFQYGNQKNCLMKVFATSNNSLSPAFNYISAKIQLKFDENCLKQDSITFNNKTVVNTYIVYEINLWPFKQRADFTLGNSLLGAVKLTKNADFDK